MKYTKENIKTADLSELQNYKIRIVAKSNRRGGSKLFNGKPNCSGFNINKLIHDGITVAQYQAIIKNNFSSSDPQFCLTKHLKYDIEHGNFELVE
ncbi:hypothetical protein HXX02_17185 [Microbulbifer elongatus]|uniref:Uncharacterized protein n=1 Tax=Microbulbifer elongatus TaxID=86173 RepID=A0ABT1P7R7_9GAMM|nr:hypothetical protein [Microbulbifer elongatus]MCQ3831169.1 hypothetical protein [Microbulbifer elongatus]